MLIYYIFSLNAHIDVKEESLIFMCSEELTLPKERFGFCCKPSGRLYYIPDRNVFVLGRGCLPWILKLGHPHPITLGWFGQLE